MAADSKIIVKNINRINELIGSYRRTVHKESFTYIGNCIRHLINELTTISHNPPCSVNYNIVYDDEKEFFTNHLPIRVNLQIKANI